MEHPVPANAVILSRTMGAERRGQMLRISFNAAEKAGSTKTIGCRHAGQSLTQAPDDAGPG